MAECSGHLTKSDGTHVPLTAEQANDLLKMAKESQRQRAEKLPDSRSCFAAMREARNRLRELGWREGAYCPRDGSSFAVAQIGSTGMWMGNWSGEIGNTLSHGLIIAADSAMNPKEVFWKSLDSLTDEEREHMNACDADTAAWVDRIARSLGAE